MSPGRACRNCTPSTIRVPDHSGSNGTRRRRAGAIGSGTDYRCGQRQTGIRPGGRSARLAARRLRRSYAAILLVAACALLAGCAAPPPAETVGDHRTASAVGSGEQLAAILAERYQPTPGSRVYRVVPEHSLVRIRVYRAGTLARLGHNHLIAVRELHGWWRQGGDGAGRGDLWFAVDRLTVDEPALRRAAGGDFAAPQAPDAIAATRDNMLGERVLAADGHPLVTVAARYRPASGSAELRIRLRGVERRYRVPVELSERGRRQQLRGELALRLSDFGLEPFSTLGGALRVADELRINFRVEAEAV